jgi:hypothetical protein
LLINKTPHQIILRHDSNSSVVCELQEGDVILNPELPEVRCKVNSVVTGTITLDGKDYPLEDTEFGDVENIPEPQPGVLYVVSLLAAQALAKVGRFDFVSPGRLVRYMDGPRKGQAFACRSLVPQKQN